MDETRTGREYRLQVFVPPPLEEVARPEWCRHRGGHCCTQWVSPYMCDAVREGRVRRYGKVAECRYGPSLWTRLVRLFGHRRPSMRWSGEPRDLVAGEDVGELG